jgi:hypothetical protein
MIEEIKQLIRELRKEYKHKVINEDGRPDKIHKIKKQIEYLETKTK